MKSAIVLLNTSAGPRGMGTGMYALGACTRQSRGVPTGERGVCVCHWTKGFDCPFISAVIGAGSPRDGNTHGVAIPLAWRDVCLRGLQRSSIAWVTSPRRRSVPLSLASSTPSQRIFERRGRRPLLDVVLPAWLTRDAKPGNLALVAIMWASVDFSHPRQRAISRTTRGPQANRENHRLQALRLRLRSDRFATSPISERRVTVAQSTRKPLRSRSAPVDTCSFPQVST